ncbi:MAG: hypothetical protein WCY05_04900 [Candidatus Omnitrophota bacterium]
MRKIILCILNLIKNIFGRIADKEAERVVNFYKRVFGMSFKEWR